jgi:hypothetical protein
MTYQLYKDLSSHFHERLSKIIFDTIDTSELVELSNNDVMCILFGSLTSAAATLVIKSQGDKLDFLNACSLVFDRTIKEEPK